MQQPCLVINGLEEPGDEDEIQKIATNTKEETGTSQNTVIKNLDKIHPISQVDDAGKQINSVQKTKKINCGVKKKKSTNSCWN